MTVKLFLLKKLNLGCGNDVREGWVNLDIHRLPGVDVVHDISTLPLPFKDDEFDFILCQDILEHVDYIPILRDLHRILKKGGAIEIRVPHFTSRFNFVDPTHRHAFSVETFQFFLKSSLYHRSYYFDFHFTEVSLEKISFEKGIFLFFNFLVEPVVNLGHRTRIFYEATFLSRLFPADNIIVRLVK